MIEKERKSGRTPAADRCDEMLGPVEHVRLSELELDPVAEVFPSASEEELEQLAANIKEHGIQQPIVLGDDGRLADGRNRRDACQRAGVTEVPARRWAGDRESLAKYVYSMNLHRRHLTAGQKAAVAFKYLEFLEKSAKRRQKEHGSTAPGRPANTGGRNSTSDAGRARDRAAKIAGANPHYVQDYKKLAKDDPGLAEEVHAGKMTIPAAKKELKKREERAAGTRWRTPEKKYKTIIVGSGWAGKRDVGGLPIPELTHDGAHLYLWTNARNLLVALKLAGRWGFDYQSLLTSVTNDGPDVGGWRQTTEHVLFCRKGSLELCQKGLPLHFAADVPEGGGMPDQFYELVRRASPEPRVELFDEGHDGFESYDFEVQEPDSDPAPKVDGAGQ